MKDKTENKTEDRTEGKPERECWEDLANAVVFQALEDYAAACRRLRRRPDLREQAKRKRGLDRFFSSRWCRLLTDADLTPLIRKIAKGKEIIKGENRR